MTKWLRNEKGFTMVEMMVVLIIIAVLIGGGMGFYNGYIGKAKKTKAKAEISVMQAALDAYYAENDVYPNDDNVSKLSSAGIDTSMVTVGTNDLTKKFCYQARDTDQKTYVITTATKQDDKYIYGTGSYGKSTAPTESDSKQTTPPTV